MNIVQLLPTGKGLIALVVLLVIGVALVGIGPVLMLLGFGLLAQYGLDHHQPGLMFIGLIGAVAAMLYGRSKRK